MDDIRNAGVHLNQNETPIYDCFQAYADSGMIPFHVPGHKMGQGADPLLRQLVGGEALRFDDTALPETDNLQRPGGPLQGAMALAADLYGAKRSFMVVGGTSTAIIAMILATVSGGDKIIVQRNVHKSATAGIILSGAVPVYVEPVIDEELGIAHGVTPEAVRKALEDNPDAKAVLLVSPTYYGVCSDIRRIAETVHARRIPLLVDEAHGAHLRFSGKLPDDALSQGADLVAQSTHKTAGSLTQSSLLHVCGDLISADHVASVLNLLQTTSPSFLLLSSLDTARRNMALHGSELWDRTVDLYQSARRRINEIEGCYVFDAGHVAALGFRDFDPTRLTICGWDLHMTGHELEKTLSEDYHLQMELSDYYNVLAVGTYADSPASIERLVNALAEISRSHEYARQTLTCLPLPEIPEQIENPRKAFFSWNHPVPIQDSIGEVSAEFIMTYPPGIPVLCPGERITGEIIGYMRAMQDAKLLITGLEDPDMEHIKVLNG